MNNAVSNDVAATSRIKGRLDGVFEAGIVGWVYNPQYPDLRHDVAVVVDDAEICIVSACMPRKELAQAGFGDGKYGYQANLPVSVLDGTPHQVRTYALISRSADSLQRIELAGSPLIFLRGGVKYGSVSGDIALDGVHVAGWWHNPDRDFGSCIIEIHDFGRLVAAAKPIGSTAHPGRANFRIRLPDDVFDGKAHHLSVFAQPDGLLIGEVAEIFPPITTREDLLRRYRVDYVSGYLFPTAGFRYESLRRQLHELYLRAQQPGLGNDVSLPIQFSDLLRAHEQVIEGFELPLLGAPVHYETLHFDCPDKPEVSVVVPAHGKFRMTYNCLAALRLAWNRTSHEIILVDDGSDDLTSTAESLFKGVRVLRNEKPLGFLHACNTASKQARGRYLLFLNNDTEVTTGWIDELLQLFRSDERIGMAGGKLLFADGRLQEAGGIVTDNCDAVHYGRGGNAHEPRFSYVRDVDYVSGACLMISKSLWEKLGGFDSRYTPAYWEDTDLAFRVREAGYRVVYTPFCQVIHFEGGTSGKDISQGAKKYQEINRHKFATRWKSVCEARRKVNDLPDGVPSGGSKGVPSRVSNGVSNDNADLAKDRNALFRVLVIDAEVPQPDKDAGSYAAVQEMRLLQSLGGKVTFASQAMTYLGEHTDKLQKMGVECLYAPFFSSIADVLNRRGGEFSLFYCIRYETAMTYLEGIRMVNPEAKVILNNCDLHFLRELRIAMNARNKGLLAGVAVTRAEELDVMTKVDLVLTYSDVEQAVIESHNLDRTVVARCPWVVDVAKTVPGYGDRIDLAFLGFFGHYPNREAMQFFTREVMPALAADIPGLRLRIYGSYMPDDMDAITQSGHVSLEGWIDDPRKVYASCRIFVAPLQSGAGVKGKIISAMAQGVPCVLSPIASEGLRLQDGHTAFLASTAQQWISKIKRLYCDRQLWEKTSDASLQFAASEFDFAKGREMMHGILVKSGVRVAPASASNAIPLRE